MAKIYKHRRNESMLGDREKLEKQFDVEASNSIDMTKDLDQQNHGDYFNTYSKDTSRDYKSIFKNILFVLLILVVLFIVLSILL